MLDLIAPFADAGLSGANIAVLIWVTTRLMKLERSVEFIRGHLFGWPKYEKGDSTDV